VLEENLPPTKLRTLGYLARDATGAEVWAVLEVMGLPSKRFLVYSDQKGLDFRDFFGYCVLVGRRST